MLETILKTGQKVPYFECNDDKNNLIKTSDFKEKKWIVFFYPKANTPGCTAEACNLRDNYEILKNKGYEIVGVSADPVSKQKKFSEKYTFPFPLLADEEKNVINAFGVWGQKKFMGKEFEGIHRITFIINKKGIVESVIDKVKTKDHVSQILELIGNK